MLLKFSRFQNFAHRAMQKIALLGFAVLSLGLVSELSFGQPIEQERKLARLEATYISHLSKYIHWDDNSSASSLKIIIHGDDRVKFKDTLEYVMKISSPELALEILEFSNNQTDRALLEINKGFNCLILLQNSSMNAEQLSGMEKLGVVIVHGKKLFKSSKSQIAFEHAQNRVRLLIDRDSIGEKRNQISSKLADLKSAVKVINKSR